MMITKKGLSLHWEHCKANRGLQTRRAICPYLTSRKSKKPSGCSLFWTQSAAGWNTVCMTDKRRIMHQVCPSNHGMCNGHVDTWLKGQADLFAKSSLIRGVSVARLASGWVRGRLLQAKTQHRSKKDSVCTELGQERLIWGTTFVNKSTQEKKLEIC